MLNSIHLVVCQSNRVFFRIVLNQESANNFIDGEKYVYGAHDIRGSGMKIREHKNLQKGSNIHPVNLLEFDLWKNLNAWPKWFLE